MGVYILKKSNDKSIESFLKEVEMNPGDTLRNQEETWAVPFQGGFLTKGKMKFRIVKIQKEKDFTLFHIHHNKMTAKSIKEFLFNKKHQNTNVQTINQISIPKES